MATVRGFIAASLDGYIATLDGGVDWLKPFEKLDYGYDRFIAEVRSAVMDCRTYDQLPSLSPEWPYPGKTARGHVAAPGLSPTRRQCPARWLERLVAYLRQLRTGNVWLVGGSMLHSAVLDLVGLDRLELFVIPVLLGDGVPLWPKSITTHRLSLRAVDKLDGDMVRLDYAIHIGATTDLKRRLRARKNTCARESVTYGALRGRRTVESFEPYLTLGSGHGGGVSAAGEIPGIVEVPRDKMNAVAQPGLPGRESPRFRSIDRSQDAPSS